MGRRAVAWRPVVQLGFALTCAAACSSLGPPKPASPQWQRDVLTREEILGSTAQQGDLLDAIHSLRPHFLAIPRGTYSRASPAATPLAVYVNRMRQSGAESLRSIAASKVAEVRYLEPTAALNEFGPVASGGALLVTMFDPSKEPSGPVDGVFLRR
jgi:hypothetical protein